MDELTVMVCPPDHAHAGTEKLTCYVEHRCRCEQCREFAAAYDAWRQRMNRAGRPLMIPALGTQRRIQALMMLGWSMAAIADRLNDRRGNVHRLLTVDRISARLADKITVVYDELSMRVPVARDRHARSTIARTRMFAARQGWHPPLAWDDIDHDPAPAAPTDEGPIIDPVSIELALSGRKVRLTPAERRDCVLHLHRKQWSDPRIAECLGCNVKTIGRIREELGLEAWAITVLVGRNAA